MRARAGLELFDSKLYTKAVIETGDVIAIVDEKYSFLFASKLLTRYIKKERTEIEGHTVPEVVGENFFNNELKTNIDNSLQGRHTTFEVTLPSPDLGTRYFNLKCYPVTEKGVRTVIVLAMDITRLKQRVYTLLQDRQIYRVVLQKANDIILIMDPDGTIVSCSRYVDRQTGLSSKAVIGQSVQRILTPESFKTVVSHMRDWQNHRTGSQAWEAEVVSHAGKAVPFEVHSTPVYGQGKLKWVLVIARNISERKRMEEKSKRSFRELEAVVQGSQQTVRKMEAEFNQLSNRILEDQERERHAIGRELHDEMGGYLTILGIYLGKMAKDPGNVAWREQFTQAFDEMVQYIRSLSHSLYPVMLEQGDLLNALMSYFENYQRRVGVNVIFKYRGLRQHLPKHIEAVIYRIIQEALTNVAKHAAAEWVKVYITRLKSAIKILIEDNGRGFDVSKAGKAGAYGISGMKNRALFAGGSLVINSTPGQGTSIVCILPISTVNGPETRGLPLKE